MGSSVHNDNKRKDILSLGEGSKQRLDDTKLTTETIYPIKFYTTKQKICMKSTL